MTPDWDGKPVTVPYAEFGDPQSLNLYSYVRNSPIARIDIDGHDFVNEGFQDWGFDLGDPTWGISAQPEDDGTQINIPYPPKSPCDPPDDNSKKKNDKKKNDGDQQGSKKEPEKQQEENQKKEGGQQQGQQQQEQQQVRRVSNPKHNPNSASPEPQNVQELFDRSIVDKKGVRWAKDSDGTIHRFSKPSNGESHWNGSTKGPKPIRMEDIPIEIRRALQ